MKKLFILLLIIPILGFSQNDLVFNRVLNFNITSSEAVVVPEGKVWKIEFGISSATLLITSTNQPYGNDLNSDNSNGFQTQSVTSPMWLGAGCTISVGNNNSNMISILEFNVVAASTSTGGSGGDNTGNSTNNNDGYSSNSGSSSSSNSYDGNNSNLSTPGDDFTDSEGNTYSTTVVDGLVWTTSNANHSTYRDGTTIPHITDKTEWDNATTGAWTYYAQDESNGWGKIYNAYAIRGKNDNDPNTPNKTFAPQGWRLPSQSNWLSLATMFKIPPATSININSGTALKSTTGWLSVPGNNHSGLNMKPYGYLAYGNTEDSWNNGVGLASTYFWAATAQQNNVYQITMGVYDNGDGVQLVTNYTSTPYNGYLYSGSTLFNSGNYVRLIKDAN